MEINLQISSISVGNDIDLDLFEYFYQIIVKRKEIKIIIKTKPIPKFEETLYLKVGL